MWKWVAFIKRITFNDFFQQRVLVLSCVEQLSWKFFPKWKQLIPNARIWKIVKDFFEDSFIEAKGY